MRQTYGAETYQSLYDIDLLALAVFDDIAGNDGVFHHGGAAAPVAGLLVCDLLC